MKIIKKDLVSKVAKYSCVSKKTASTVIEALIQVVKNEVLDKENTVSLSSLGVFKVKEYQYRDKKGIERVVRKIKLKTSKYSIERT